MSTKTLLLSLLVCAAACVSTTNAFAQKQLPITPVSGQSITEKRVKVGEEDYRDALDKTLMQAYDARQKGDTSRAISLFGQAVRKYGAYIEASEPLGELLMEERRYPDAVELYRAFFYKWEDKKWGSGRDQSVDLLARFAFALSATGNKEEAWDVFQKIAGQLPEYLKPYAASLKNRTSYNDATLRAIALTTLGVTYNGNMIVEPDGSRHVMDNKPDAVANYKLALKYSPHFAPAYYRLAVTLQETGNIQAAKQALSQAEKYADGMLQSVIKKDASLNKLR